MKIKICVGSSCHIRGSAQVIEAFRRILADQGPEEQNQIELGAGFCLGECQNGVNVVIDGVMYHNVTPEFVPALLKGLKTEGTGPEGKQNV